MKLSYYWTNTSGVGSLAHKIIIAHSVAVKDMALKIASKNPHLKIDISLLTKAALLHDIGAIKTNNPSIGCYGDLPYICHGYKGREILENEKLYDVAPFCERHTGTGITKEEIIKLNLPIPHRDMVPITIEEKKYSVMLISFFQNRVLTLPSQKN